MKKKTFKIILLFFIFFSISTTFLVSAKGLLFTYNGEEIWSRDSIGRGYVYSGETIRVNHNQTKLHGGMPMKVRLFKKNWWGGSDFIAQHSIDGNAYGKNLYFSSRGEGTYYLNFLTDEAYSKYNVWGSFYSE